MATAAQIAANRRNAKKSTGPRTVQGKERAKMNALMHGLHAGTLERPEEGQRRKDLRERLQAEWTPGSTMECVVLDQLVETTLMLERVPEANAAVLTMLRRKLDVPAEISDARVMAADLSSGQSRLEPVYRFHDRTSRQLTRLLRNLNELQRNRFARDEEPEGANEANFQTVQTNPIPSQTLNPKPVTAVEKPLAFPTTDYASVAASRIGQRMGAKRPAPGVPTPLSA